MRVPGWLDVALEGGVTELQKALAETTALRRAVRGHWRGRAQSLAEHTKAFWLKQEAIDDQLARARKRVRLEPRAKTVLPLVERVERERLALHHDLERVLDAKGVPEATAFRRMIELAEHWSWFESAWRRFRLERSVLGALLGVLTAAIPLACWLDASWWGSVPTKVAVRTLREQHWYWVGVLLLLGAGLSCWWRLGTWRWLGVRRSALIMPVLIGVGTTLFTASFMLDLGVGMGLGLLGAALTLALGLVYHSWWLPADEEPLEPLVGSDPAVTTEETVGDRGAC